MDKHLNYLIFLILMLISPRLFADLEVPVYFTVEEGRGKLAGTIILSETTYGLLFTPNLKNLPSGIHGFGVHLIADCSQKGASAGGHLDPDKTKKHLGPYNDQGHLGDLPALYVNADGKSTLPVLAPRLKKIKEVLNHSLIIYEGGDNYSDKPEKLGGGGNRLVCGIVTYSKTKN